MMDINATRTSMYMQVVVSDGGATIHSGLLDEKESISLAVDLIYAAESLLPAGFGEIEHALSKQRALLNKGNG